MSSTSNRETNANKTKYITRRRYKLPIPTWQGTLVSYYKMKNKRTTLTTANRGKQSCNVKPRKPLVVDLVDELHDECDENSVFVLLVTVSLLKNELIPSIILVDKEKFNEIATCNKKLLKYDIHGTSYVGRILACSNSRKQLEKTLDQVMLNEKDLFTLEKTNTQKIMYSCTSIVDVEIAQENEILVIALRVLLKDHFQEAISSELRLDNSIESVPVCETEDLAQGREEQEQDDLPVIDGNLLTPCNESSADDCDSNHSNHFTWRSPPASIDFNTIDYDNSNRRTNTDTSSCVALESQCSARQVPPSKTPASEASTSTSDHNTKKSSTFDHAIVSNSGSRIKKRRSKVKKFFADDKLLAKVKTEAFERKAAFDESIKESFNFLDQTIPTLKSSKPYQPILVHVSKLLHDLNSKMEENDKIKSISSGYMIEKKIEVKKTRDGNVKIGGRLILPSKIYGYIISRNEPNLIVSRTIRRLYDKNIRQGAELNEKADMSNFIFRIGDPELDGEERLSDGQKIVDIIIEHAHQVLGLDFVCFKEYRECMTQVGKAVYDANRPEGSKKRKVNTFDDNDEQASKRYRKINIETESEEDHVQSEPESARQKNRVNLELFI